MRAKQILEKLQLLATYFTLAASDAGKEQNKQFVLADSEDNILTSFYKGKRQAYNTAFKKVDAIIKEAKQ